MDYHAVHGRDESSFDLPSTHRMPTVTAADALDELDGRTAISTGLDDLDTLLTKDGSATGGGVHRGQVTEVWGPPGVGKTALGIQLAARTLCDGRGVVWVDGAFPVHKARLQSAVASTNRHHRQSGEGVADDGAMSRFIHYTCPSLPHLVAVLCRPTASCIPESTALVVVDALSALVSHVFPKTADPRPVVNANSTREPTPSTRRIQLLQYMVSALQKLAATRDLAVVVLSQCATRMTAEKGAILIPAITAGSWEQGVSTRVALFRDWSWDALVNDFKGAHFAAVQKLHGQVKTGLLRQFAAFDVREDGLHLLTTDNSPPSLGADYEVPDSEDDAYGWREDEDVMPEMPSQWQGSEDLLLGTQDGRSDSSEERDEKDKPAAPEDARSLGPQHE